MSAKYILLVLSIALFLKQNDALNVNRNSQKLECKHQCATTGQNFYFNKINKICKCLPAILKKKVTKRETTENKSDDVIISTTTTTTIAPIEVPEMIVGQSAPNALKRQKEPRQLTPEQQKKIVQQIRNHLTRLESLLDPKKRDSEIETIKNSLDQLTHTALTAPKLRSRSQLEENKKKLKGGTKNEKKKFEIITQDPRLID